MSKNFRKAIYAILIVLALFSISRYIMYGSVLRSCVYTTDEISVPAELSSGALTTIKLSARVTNYEVYNCADSIFSSADMIVESQSRSGYEHYPGVTISEMPTGATFKVIGIKEVTKHGITTMDSGPGPIYFLVLQEPSGKIYTIATVSLGINDSDRFFSLTKEDKTQHIIGPDNFFDHETGQFRFNLE